MRNVMIFVADGPQNFSTTGHKYFVITKTDLTFYSWKRMQNIMRPVATIVELSHAARKGV